MQVNIREAKVLKVILKAGEPISIREVAKAAFPNVTPTTKADSWVRNSVRRATAVGWVRRAGTGLKSGLYKLDGRSSTKVEEAIANPRELRKGVKAEPKQAKVKAKATAKVKAEPKQAVKAEPKQAKVKAAKAAKPKTAAKVKAEPKQAVKAEPKQAVKAEPKQAVKAEPKQAKVKAAKAAKPKTAAKVKQPEPTESQTSEIEVDVKPLDVADVVSADIVDQVAA